MSKRRPALRLSRLLSFVDCARPRTIDPDLIGSEGFSRVVFCNDPDKHSQPPVNYSNNYISTTKYNLITFFPKALFEQFRRVAYIYFLVTALIGLTPLSPYTAESLIAPLVLVVGVSMVKEAIEDFYRWKADQEVNRRKVLTHVGNGVFEKKQWQQLRVGDVVYVEKDSYFPADLLLLSSSYEDGVCYVETMNLDGETNLKLRKAQEATLILDDESKMKDFSARINCEDPNTSLYTFVGNLSWQDETLSLEPQQILLRDSKLKNTSYVYGVCIFTGHDTKVMQNSSTPRSKRSRIEKRMNRVMYLLFGLLLLMSISGSIAFGLRTRFQSVSWWYLRPDSADAYYNPSKAALAALLQAVTDIVLYSYLIPISLYVTIEVVKVIQVAFMGLDLHMYHSETDMRARARTSNLNEELGQVDTILSDKTGTLTCNQMEFLKCSIAGTSYGRGVTEVELASAKRLGKDPTELEDYEPPPPPGAEADVTKVKGFALKDARLMKHAWASSEDAAAIRMFLTILSVCHTAIPETDEQTQAVTYEAESPDEAAFVVTAQQMGFEFCKRTQHSVTVRETLASPSDGQDTAEREYEVLHTLEFSSARKRMSVVVRDPQGDIFVFCKGADSVIFERLSQSPAARQHLEATRAHLARYGDAGLRTLALAYRRVEPAFFQQWDASFQAARTHLGPDRLERIEQASSELEQELVLLGATAVEDKLQKGVPEAIDRLALAGIKIWVLTGDKMETAINIAFACSLLRPDMERMEVTLDLPAVRLAEDEGDPDKTKALCRGLVAKQLTDCAERLDAAVGAEEPRVFALVIDGKSLTYALEAALRPLLLGLALQCASVVCCRVSPKQKALVVRLVKEGTGRVTLAIGDGANDVGMIQEADIGVGISGVEGQQAVMASDFAIAQFRFLERLLLVHGHWCYKRIANMVTYFFYKNLAFGLTLYYYNGYAVFTGQVIYNSWYASAYNVFFTSLPVGILGSLEQDLPASTCLQFPILYQSGPRNLWFSWPRILLWMLNGLYVSVVGFWALLAAMSPQALRSTGFLPELPGLGATLYAAIVWAVNVQIFLMLDYVTWLHHALIWGSVALFYVFSLVFDFLTVSFSSTGYHLFTEALSPSAQYWLLVLLLAAMQLLPFVVYKAVQVRCNPLDHEVVHEMDLVRSKGKGDDEVDSEWSQQGKRAVAQANIGFTAAVEAVVRRLRKKKKIARAEGKAGAEGFIGAARELAETVEDADVNGTTQ